ncbi:MAG: outer membrane lipoprotein carrier protein LolA [Pirellulales bacterium]|nr:outer membrane lipoprotein carrier protein LolA [Pirellulales bacterium]
MEDHEDIHHDDLLERAVNAVLRDPIPGELPPDQVAQLVAAVRQAADQPYPMTIIERIKNMRPRTRMAVAAAVLVAFFGLLSWLVPGSGAALAFADVAEAINGIHTATWKFTVVVKRPQGEAETTTGVGMFMAPSHERMERTVKGVASIIVFDGQEDKMVSHDAKTKTAVVVKLKNFPAGAPLGRSFVDLREMIANAKSGKGGNVERLGIETIDGRRVEAFRIRYRNVDGKAVGETKIWADPKTSLPVRVENVGGGEVEVRIVMTDFQVGVDLDPALFSLDAPEGYRVNQEQLDFSKGPLGPLADTLGMAAERNDGVFPATLRGEQGMDGIMKRSVANRWKEYGMDVDKDLRLLPGQDVGRLTKENLEELQKEGLEIVTKLPAAMASLHAIMRHGDWHYAGKDVKLGTPNRPIFWCKIGNNYHVIYADLSVKEVSLQDVPKVPQSEGSPQP